MTRASSARPRAVRVAPLARLVSYRADAVVSRELVRRKTGTVTLFAFDRGQGLSEHTAPYDALVIVLDGAARITIADRRYRVRTGEMVIMPARVPHALAAVQRFKMLLVMIRGT